MIFLEVSDYNSLVSQEITHYAHWNINSFLSEGAFGKIFNIQKENDTQQYIIKLENEGNETFLNELLFYLEIKAIKPININILELISYNLDITVNNVKQGNIILPKLNYSLNPFNFEFEYFNIFCTKIINALEYINSLNLVHSDISPKNIVFDYIWEPYIIDFGLTKNFKNLEYKKLKGDLMGTYIYMSLDAHQGLVGQRNDLLSFGYILYEILECHKLPWNSKYFFKPYKAIFEFYKTKYKDYNMLYNYIYKKYICYDIIKKKKKFALNNKLKYYNNQILIDYFKIIKMGNYNDKPLYDKLYKLFI